jgi:hypothetical protein
MSPVRAFFAVLVVSSFAFAQTAAAQNWMRYPMIEDRFSINFPNEPELETIAFTSEDGMMIPARRYSATSEEERYVVTVVDFYDHYDANDTTVQGSMAYAADLIRRRVERIDQITYDAHMRIDRIPGHALQITPPDGGFLYVLILLHQDESLNARRLYITEAQVPAGVPPPGLFQQSLEILDAEGADIRYAPDGLTRTE